MESEYKKEQIKLIAVTEQQRSQLGTPWNTTKNHNVINNLIFQKLEEQVKLGKTKSIGLSNFSISQIENILKKAEIQPANLQIESHVYLQQKEIVDFCNKNNITVVAYSPLGSPGMGEFYESCGKK